MLPLMVFAASVADLPSFACTPANAPIEAAICADPELAAYDRAMALAYPRMKPALRATQKAWLAERDRCSSVPKVKVCIRRAYTRRLLMEGGVFGTSQKPERATVPTYLRSKDDGPGGLALLDVGGGKYVYHLWSTYFSYAYSEDHPQEISGDLFGVITMRDGVGHDAAANICAVTIKPNGNAWVVSADSDCLGLNNNPRGTYVPRRT